MLTAMSIGTNTRILRAIRRWNQDELAERAGISAGTVRRVEQTDNANLDTARALARAFGIPLADLLDKYVSTHSVDSDTQPAPESVDQPSTPQNTTRNGDGVSCDPD